MPSDQTIPSDQPHPPISFKFTVTFSDAEYRHLAAHTKRLVALDPAPDSPAGCALQLLAFVVDRYEQIRFNAALGQPPVDPNEPVAVPLGENMVG